ncbi:MAG: YbbR-like domain-containing protein [Prevotella sp.]|nr:YbbR-like domain-containing protein [Prevotella sp.]
MAPRWLRIISLFRNLLFSMVNKEFLIFLFFLALSGIFWLLMTLNETFEKELTVELRLSKVPKNVVITNDMASSVRFTVRDKGYMIGGYLYGNQLHPLTIDFSAYANGKGYGSIPASDLQKQLYLQLYKSSKITAVKPDKVEFTYNFGRHKKIPVRMLGSVIPSNSYYLSHISFKPESVTVYASKDLLDSVQTAYTERQRIKNFRDTMTVEASLRKIRGVKFVPSTVKMKLFPDILTEESVEVPVEAINMPEDKVLRTFPAKVRVKFVVGAHRLRTMPKNAETKQLLPNGFRVVVDYKDLIEHPSEKCKVLLRATPSGIRNAKPEVEELDYLIEQR